MIKDISKIMTWHVWKVTYLCRNVTIVCGASYHLLGSWISQDLKIRFRLQVKSYISNWRLSESWHLGRYVSRHNAMAYDKPWHHNTICSHPHPNFPKFYPHLHKYNSVRVYPYVYPQHIKVLKHFVYVWYGCGMLSEAVCSLNHDTTTFRKFTPPCTGITV